MKSKISEAIEAIRTDKSQKEFLLGDFKVIEKCNSVMFNAIRDRLKKFFLTNDQAEEEELKETIIADLKIDSHEFHSFLRIAKLFMGGFKDQSPAKLDTPRDITNDLIEVGLIDKSSRQNFEAFIAFTKAFVQDDLHLHLLKEHVLINKGISLLQGAETAVDFRAVFEEEALFGQGKKDYKPNCVGVVPLAMITISLSGREKGSITFQCKPDQLKHLIKTLEDILVEIDEAERFLNLEI